MPGMLLIHLTPYTPDPDDAATTNDVGVYVATHLLAGRSLFAILDDRFVHDRLDEHPFLLDELARDFSVMQVLLATSSAATLATAAGSSVSTLQAGGADVPRRLAA
jgi:hypothetical protein